MVRRKAAKRSGLPAAVDDSRDTLEADDLDNLLAEELQDPWFRSAYDDAGVRETLLSDLLEARHQAGLTQTAVAEMMSTSQSAVSELEGGLAEPRLSTLQRYARAVGCRIAAWVVRQEASSDDVFTAFVRNESIYLGGSQYLPYPTARWVNDQLISLQVLGATPHTPEQFCFMGSISIITPVSRSQLLGPGGPVGISECSLVDTRVAL
jgi:transcriptional regulator with XRE-family HTH domain